MNKWISLLQGLIPLEASLIPVIHLDPESQKIAAVVLVSENAILSALNPPKPVEIPPVQQTNLFTGTTSTLQAGPAFNPFAAKNQAMTQK